MDIADKLMLTGGISQANFSRDLGKLDGKSEEEKKQIAKDFESVFVSKLLDEMKNSIGEWGFEKDGASEQVDGMFWMYLARDIADRGGFGLWKDIYKFLTNSDQTKAIEK
jgi:Rod binding domain-containing protein